MVTKVAAVLLTNLILFTSTNKQVTTVSSQSSSYSDYDASKINHHLQEGNNALSSGDLAKAIQHYESCLSFDSNERYCNINLASTLIDMNEIEQDESIKEERTTRAISTLRHVLKSFPRDADAAFNLALILQDTSKSVEITREAAKLYQIAVEASEEDRWDAYANMAAAKQELGDFTGRYGARRSYERAIVLLEGMKQEYEKYIDQMVNDEDAETREFDEEKFNEAQEQVNALNQYLSKLYYGYASILSELSGSDCLKLMKEESLLIDVQDGVDEKSSKVVCESNAVNALRMSVNLNDENVVAIHMLNSMTAGEDGDDEFSQGKDRASNEFVSALFDDFADTFDEKLGALGYKVPHLIGEAAYDLLQMSPNKDMFDSILDAGCGTGLAGRFLRPLCQGPLVGVDLSKKMLELASQCTLTKGCGLKTEENDSTEEEANDERGKISLYDKLVALDLETASIDELALGLPDDSLENDGFDLIVAADVLVYLGDLQKVLNNFAELSKGDESQSSFLVFSCERIEEEDAPQTGWKLQSSGRYAHSRSYVERTAEEAGFYIVGYEEIVPRQEKGEDVKGHMFIFAIGGEPYGEEEDGSQYEVSYEMFDTDPRLDEL